jgi:hypothetical protein
VVAYPQRVPVGQLLTFHHDPVRTDDEVDALVHSLRARMPTPVSAATEGQTILL